MLRGNRLAILSAEQVAVLQMKYPS
jgi:hypothetical protein